jgi:hypothetical protein
MDLPESHPRRLIPELCRLFYRLGWVTGTGGGKSARNKNFLLLTERKNAKAFPSNWTAIYSLPLLVCRRNAFNPKTCLYIRSMEPRRMLHLQQRFIFFLLCLLGFCKQTRSNRDTRLLNALRCFSLPTTSAEQELSFTLTLSTLLEPHFLLKAMSFESHIKK